MRTILQLATMLMLFTASPLASAQPARPNLPPIRVEIFVRTDCPISNRYAPEIQRLQAEFAPRNVSFTLVYPNRDETSGQVGQNLRDYRYHLPAERDPGGKLIADAHVTITPEAAVFDHGKLIYHGRIDDQVAAFGKVRSQATTHELEDAINAALDGHLPAVAYAPAVGCTLSDVR